MQRLEDYENRCICVYSQGYRYDCLLRSSNELDHATNFEQYQELRPLFHREPLSSTAHLLDKLLGMVRGSQASDHLGWTMKSYLSAARIREIEESVDEESEDII